MSSSAVRGDSGSIRQWKSGRARSPDDVEHANQEGARGKQRTHVDGFADGIGNDFHHLRLSRVDVCEIPRSNPNWSCSRVKETGLREAQRGLKLFLFASKIAMRRRCAVAPTGTGMLSR